MTLLVPLLLAFAVVVLAGNSLRRKGHWSTGMYVAWLAVAALLCLVVAGLLFFPRATSR
jgi:hypothetical protein